MLERQTDKQDRQAACFVSSLRTWFEHFFRERLPVEGVVGRGEEMPIDVFSIHHLPGRGQQDGVLHQLAHHRIYRKDGGKVKKEKKNDHMVVCVEGVARNVSPFFIMWRSRVSGCHCFF